jgi:hypothetical protein
LETVDDLLHAGQLNAFCVDVPAIAGDGPLGVEKLSGGRGSRGCRGGLAEEVGLDDRGLSFVHGRDGLPKVLLS